MKINRHWLSLPIVAAMGVSIGSCGKDSSSEEGEEEKANETPKTNQDPEKTAGTSSDNTFKVTGQLAIATGLVESQRQILSFSLLGGQILDQPTKVTVDGDGKFSMNAAKTNVLIEAAKKALTQSPIDREGLIKAFPQYATEIKSISEDQMREYFSELVAQSEAQGGPQLIVVSYLPGGSALDEAKTFQFIGLPTGGSNDVIVIPGDSVTGDIALGKINPGSGDKATSELKADTSVFSLDQSSITQLASIGQTLKVIKNYWANRTGSANDVSSRAEPFFMWNDTILHAQQGSQPSDLRYSGWGTYVAVTTNSIDFDKLCPAGSGPSYGTPTQSITFTPPSAVTWGQMGNDGQISNPQQMGPNHPFNNGQTTQTNQNGKMVCNGGQTGFYARNDGGGRYMLNWGTGGSIQGVIPNGFWSLKLDDKSLGDHDFSAAFPLDSNNKPKVLVPSVKISSEGANLKAITVTWQVYNSVTSAYEEVTDVKLFQKMSAEVSISVSVGNGNGNDERRGVAGRKSQNDFEVKWTGTKIQADMPEAFRLPFSSNWGEQGKITSIMVSYKIGSSTYNFGFR